MPQNHAAYMPEATPTKYAVGEAPYPKPGAGQLVIKNAAVAINPVDHLLMSVDFMKFAYPFVIGEDAAGEVVEVGPGVTNFKPGDRAISYLLGLATRNSANAAFQEYVLADAVVTAKLPSNIPYEKGVVLPLGLSTAAHGLYGKEQLALPYPSLSPKPSGKVLLVWGGSSSVGVNGVQLARASGFDVLSVASAHNHALIKSVGASAVFDQSSPSLVDDVVAAIGDREIGGILDAIGKETSLKAGNEILSRVKGTKKIASAVPGMAKFADKGVVISSISATDVGLKQSEIGKAVWGDWLSSALESGLIVPKPDPNVVGSGLGAIDAAVIQLRSGVSASKLVVTI